MKFFPSYLFSRFFTPRKPTPSTDNKPVNESKEINSKDPIQIPKPLHRLDGTENPAQNKPPTNPTLGCCDKGNCGDCLETTRKGIVVELDEASGIPPGDKEKILKLLNKH
ncbi:MAG: hypothetical protein CL521_03565, partial [Actinobacteria bacterium]|nr:hypothetical protein [Actinomycetota bacterium]